LNAIEANLIRQRTREGMEIARQNGKLRGKQSPPRTARPPQHDSGDYNVAGIAALFSVSRPTVYRSLDRTAELPPLPASTLPVPDVTKYDQLLTRNPGQQ
jgi:DNA invertase Pin-like site-specific DNA recombinase